MFDVLYKIFLETTDPKTEFDRLYSLDIAFSILIHLFFYVIVYMLLVQLFGLPYRPISVLFLLLVVVIVGYYGRLQRSKSIYSVLKNMGYTDKESHNKAMATIRNGYFTWYFLG